MLLTIFLSFAALVVVFLIVASLRSTDFTIRRTATLSAPAEVIFGQVNDFHHWPAWSPWAEMDRSARNTYSGAESGPGARFAWDGNREVGAGRMTILESRPAESIRLQLDFLRPFKATNLTEFTFQPQGEQTLVTWSMSGKRNLMMKAATLLMNCEEMVGQQFAQGLANLEKAAQVTATAAR